jgi:drug/metabolite transporter (DMT)-like permease
MTDSWRVMTQSRSGAWALIGAAVLWGAAPAAIRFSVTRMSASEFVALRSALAAATLLPFVRWELLVGASARDRRRIAICCFLGGGSNLPMAYGLERVSAITGTLITSLEPILILLFGAWSLRRWPQRRVALGSGIAWAGVVVLLLPRASLSGAGSSYFLLGAAEVALGALMWSAYTITILPLSDRWGALAATAWTATLGGVIPVLCPLVVSSELVVPSLENWLVIALLALTSTVVAVYLWNYGVVRVRSDRASVALYLVPIAGVLTAVIWLHEHITIGILVSGTAVLVGVAVSNARILLPPGTDDGVGSAPADGLAVASSDSLGRPDP